MNRDKAKGMIIGGAIGDAFGMPVETWTPEKILQYYPQGLNKFVSPKDHKWFNSDTPAGTTTDDTQLTIATMKGMIGSRHKLEDYMDGIANAHCQAMKSTTDGWGNTTKEAIRRLQNGTHWSESGKTNDASRGLGNGVPMKISPLAVFRISKHGKEMKDFNKFCVDYSAMTHYTKMSAYAAICHTYVMALCLSAKTSKSIYRDILNFILDLSKFQNNLLHLNDTKDNLQDRLNKFKELNLSSMDQVDIIKEFGDGSCYVYESLPFSYAWFLKDPFSFNTINKVVMAGGDTDTNGKIVGEMLGALYGYDALKVSMPWAIDGLIGINDLLLVVDEFCDFFDIL
jgi:ADP-ribosylglycohydrolase